MPKSKSPKPKTVSCCRCGHWETRILPKDEVQQILNAGFRAAPFEAKGGWLCPWCQQVEDCDAQKN